MVNIRKAQISIDYIGGAVVFFVSVLFIVTGVLNVMPEFTDNVVQNRLETKSWSLSTVLLSTEGYWENENESGSDWQNNVDDVLSFGLQSRDEQGLDRDKIQALDRVDYQEVKNTFGTGFDFAIDFTEYITVDTSGEVPEKIEIPESLEEQELNFGSRQVDGEVYYFLVHESSGDYNVSVSSGTNFSKDLDSFITEVNSTGVVDFGDRQFTVEIPNSGVVESEGKLLVLQTSIQRIGRRVPPDPGEVVSIRRFSNTGKNVVRMDVRMWQR